MAVDVANVAVQAAMWIFSYGSSGGSKKGTLALIARGGKRAAGSGQRRRKEIVGRGASGLCWYPVEVQLVATNKEVRLQ